MNMNDDFLQVDAPPPDEIEVPPPDVDKIAELMIKYLRMKNELDELGREIQQGVLALGKTQKVGRLSASYYKEQGTWDWENIAKDSNASDEVIEECTGRWYDTDYPAIVQALEDYVPEDEFDRIFTENCVEHSNIDWKGVCLQIGIENPDEKYYQKTKEARVLLRLNDG